jgi:hypothetical protein
MAWHGVAWHGVAGLGEAWHGEVIITCIVISYDKQGVAGHGKARISYPSSKRENKQ